MKKIIGLATAILVLAAAACGQQEIDERAIVKIFTVSNNPDYYQPWQMSGQSSSNGSGCIIKGNRILTSAHVVSNHTFIQVLKSGESKKYVAKVAAIDHESDLALLYVADKDFFAGIKPVDIGGMPRTGDKVKVLGFPIGGDKLSVTEGVVSRIEIGKYSHSLREFITIQTDAAINPGNSGGPMFLKGKVAGVAFQGMTESQSIGYAIPSVVISRFLKDLEDGSYGGFPSLGIMWQNLESEPYRLKLGLRKKQAGVAVTGVEYGSSGWGVLKEGDVIVSADKVRIENDGTIPYGAGSRIDFSHITNMKFTGEEVVLEIIRDKKPKKLSVTMKNHRPLIPWREYDRKPQYYIFGGVVFVPMTINYIYRLWNAAGQRPAMLDRVLFEGATPGRREVIVLLQVLADETNKGYHDFSHTIVKSVEGKSVRDMQELVEVIEAVKDDFIEILLDDRQKIVLKTGESRQASPLILERYGITSDRSENLKKISAPGILYRVRKQAGE